MMKIIVEPCVIRPPNRPWVNWVASYEGYDDTGDDGLGETKSEAVADLFERFPDPGLSGRTEPQHSAGG